MKHITHWTVVFSDANPHWWDRLLTPGFRHVCAFGQLPDGWIYIDPTVRGTHVYWLTQRDYLSALDSLKTHLNATALDLLLPPDRSKSAPLFPLTCCAAIAHILDVPPHKALTPLRLYQTLIGG